jgi:hypothetical protein
MHSMKRILFFGVATLALIASCAPGAKAGMEKIFPVGNYNIQFAFPSDWKKVEDTPYDLQCTDNNAYASIFAFAEVDLAKGQTPADIFGKQKDDLVGKRKNVEIIMDEKVEETETSRIRSLLFSGERDGAKNYYYCNLVEFKEEASVFAWVMFTSTPSYAQENMDSWKRIAASAKFVGKR